MKFYQDEDADVLQLQLFLFNLWKQNLIKVKWPSQAINLVVSVNL